MVSFTLFLISFGATFFVVPLVIRLARRLGIVDHPAHRKRHDRAVAYLGGVAILGVSVPISLWVAHTQEAPTDFVKVAFLLGAAAAGCLLGLIDDWRPLRGRHKLAGQLLILIPFAVFGFRFEVLDIPTLAPIDLGYWSIPITVLWMVTVCNAVNLIDGVDGLATSVIAAAVATGGLCALVLHDRVTFLLCVAVLGALLAFLRFNWTPATIYLGDSGSLGLGILAAGLLVAVGQQASVFDGIPAPRTRYLFEYRLQLASLAFLYPVFEILLSVVRRTLQGKAIGSADNDHIHHCLQRSGWRSSQITAAATAISVLAGGAVAAAVRGLDALAAVSIMAASLSLGVILHVCGYPELFFPSRVRHARSSFLMCRYFTSMQLLKLEAASDLGESFALLEQACDELGVERMALRVPLDQGREAVRGWGGPEEAYGGAPPDDSVVLPDGSCSAEWWFHCAEYPRDLEVEYRVRIHELASQFLKRVQSAPEDELAALVAGSPPGAVDAPLSCRAIAGRRAPGDTERSTGPVASALRPRRSLD